MIIRKYKESDKERLRYICRQTAGADFQKSDKRLNAAVIIYNDYFTENEADNIFVLADESDTPVGYILCSTDYEKYKRLNLDIYQKGNKVYTLWHCMRFGFTLRSAYNKRQTRTSAHRYTA